jgi:putative transposase
VRPHSALGYRPPAPEVVIAGPLQPRRSGPTGSAQPPTAMLH